MDKRHYKFDLLAQYVRDSGKTHQQIADACGLSRVTVSRAVTGGQRGNGQALGYDALARIMAYLQQPMSSIVVDFPELGERRSRKHKKFSE